MQPTVVAMAFVCRAPAVVTKAGWAPGVTRGRVTLAATSMALARTASVNAAQAGTENTAPLVGWDRGFVWVWDPQGVYASVCAFGGDKGVGCLSACVCMKCWV